MFKLASELYRISKSINILQQQQVDKYTDAIQIALDATAENGQYDTEILFTEDSIAPNSAMTAFTASSRLQDVLIDILVPELENAGYSVNVNKRRYASSTYNTTLIISFKP